MDPLWRCAHMRLAHVEFQQRNCVMPTSLFRKSITAVAVLVFVACQPSRSRDSHSAIPATTEDPSGSPVAAHIEWWRAFADGDTAALRKRSASKVALTLSNGRTLDHANMLTESQRFGGLPHPTLDWSDTAVVRSSDGRIAVVAARLRETDPRGTTQNRVLTVLERADDVPTGWRMLAAQGTREPQRSSRLSVAAAGDLTAYSGQYRVPNGVVKITVVDSALALTDPRGMVTRLEPIGPGLFEAVPPATTTELVRLLFTRDQSGRIISLSRLTAGGLTTFPRASDP